MNHRIHLLLACIALTCGRGWSQTTQVPSPPPARERQSASVADRTVESSGFDSFRAATAARAVSPVLDQATPGDLQLRVPNLVDPAEMVVVVRKPKPIGGVYEIPYPSPEIDKDRFLELHLETAAKRRIETIKFPPFQTFDLRPATPGGRHLKLEGLSDVTIDLNGSTLQLTRTSLGLLIQDCQRIALVNGRIIGSSMLATIAKVQPDDSPAGIKFELLPEFKERLERESIGVPALLTVGSAEKGPAGAWRIRATDYAEMFVNRDRSTNRFRYSVETGSFVSTSPITSPVPFNIGNDYVWLQHQNNTGHAILLDNEDGAGNEDITFERLAFENIPGMVIVGEVVRGLHLDRISIEKNPQDPLALFAASSDSVHINANGGDIVIENCFFGPNADDKVNIKGNYWKVDLIDRKTGQIVVVPADRKTSVNRWGWRDQKVVFIKDDFSLLGTAKLTADTIRDNGKRHELTFSEIPKQVELGSLVGNVDNSGARVVIRNNIFQESRAQGILVQTSNVLVENNRFEGIAGPAIKVNLSLNEWFESIDPNNILITGNKFVRCAGSRSKSHDLIFINQFNGQDQPVEVINHLKIIGNRLLTER